MRGSIQLTVVLTAVVSSSTFADDPEPPRRRVTIMASRPEAARPKPPAATPVGRVADARGPVNGLAPVATTRQVPYDTLRGDGLLTRQLIFERERRRGEQRTARIEARRWAGISLQRPSDRSGFGATHAYQYRTPWYAFPYVYSWLGGPWPHGN